MTIIKLDTPALVLRTSDKDGRSYWDPSFQWPCAGQVKAPDWNPSRGCGNGLHGLLWGQGSGSYLNHHDPDAKWQVVEITEYVDVADTDGHPPKVKFPEGNVLFSGTREEATALIYSRAPQGTAVVGLTLTGGNRSTLTGGDDSTLTGGDDSTLTGGNRSTLTGGNRSTLTGGDDSTLTGGYGSTLTGGYGSTLTGGYGSTLTGGYGSTLTGGYGSTLTGGYGSTLTGGNRSTLTGGNRSTLTGGDDSTLIFRYYESSTGRYRRKMVELDNVEFHAGTKYRCTDKGLIVPV